jgi:hypothetical protein
MAKTLAAYRNEILTSVHGRRLGISNDEFLVGQKGMKQVVTAATSASTGTQLPNHGYITLTSTETNGTEWQIADPITGVEVTLTITSSSTYGHTVTPENATFVTSGSSTGASVILQGGGTAVTLFGISTSVYGSKNGSPGSTYIDFST